MAVPRVTVAALRATVAADTPLPAMVAAEGILHRAAMAADPPTVAAVPTVAVVRTAAVAADMGGNTLLESSPAW